MVEKMRCGSKLIDSYIKRCRQKMHRFAEDLGCNSLMRVERRKRKAANEKRAQEATEMEVARAEEQTLGILLIISVSVSETKTCCFCSQIVFVVSLLTICLHLLVEIGCTKKHIAEEARARYVEEKMAEEEDDTLSELLTLAEAGLHVENEENEFISQIADEEKTSYYKQKTDESEVEDELISHTAYVVKAT